MGSSSWMNSGGMLWEIRQKGWRVHQRVSMQIQCKTTFQREKTLQKNTEGPGQLMRSPEDQSHGKLDHIYSVCVCVCVCV